MMDLDALEYDYAADWQVLALIAELRASRAVVGAAGWYQTCRDNVERRGRVTGMDEAREGLRHALADYDRLDDSPLDRMDES